MDLNNRREDLLDIFHGFMRGKLICAAVRLGIPDAVGDGHVTLQDIASQTQTDPAALNRLLRALASMGVISQTESGSFSLTSLGEPLRRDAAKSVWASSIFWPDLIADCWTYLPECIRAGGSGGAFGAMEKKGIQSRWSMEQDGPAIFHTVFAEPDASEMGPIVAACDFSDRQVVADLGGAGGGLLSAILAVHPQVRGMLVDRAEALDGAKARFESLGLSDRCKVFASDLSESVPGGADAYLLKSVLHGYTDEVASGILRQCHKAMEPGSRLLIIETVLPRFIPKADPEVEKMMMSDINMLAVTGGQERTRDDWERLLTQSDLSLSDLRPINDSTISVIEAATRT